MSDHSTPEHPLAKWFGERKIIRLVLLVALLTLGVTHIQTLAAGAVMLLNVSLPLIAGAALAYVLDVVVRRLETLLFSGAKHPFLVKSKRALCFLLALILIALILTLIVFAIIPGMAEALTLLAKELPVYMEQLKTRLIDQFQDVPTVRDYLTGLNFEWENLQQRIVDWAVNGIGGEKFLSSTVSVIGAVTGKIANGFISIIFAIFLISGKKQLQGQFNRLIHAVYNPDHERRVHHVLSTANRCFSGFIVGQTIYGLIMGVLTWLGMRIFGMPQALVVGVISGTTALLPILGGYIGAAVGTFLVFTVDPGYALWFLLFIVALQTVLGNTIFPRLMGTSIGMPSIWVLAAVSIGGGIGGVVGMMLSVPLFATVYSLLQEWMRKKNKKTGLPPPEQAAQAS